MIITRTYKATSAYLILNGELFQFDLNAWNSRKGCRWAAIGKRQLHALLTLQRMAGIPHSLQTIFRECGDLHT